MAEYDLPAMLEHMMKVHFDLEQLLRGEAFLHSSFIPWIEISYFVFLDLKICIVFVGDWSRGVPLHRAQHGDPWLFHRLQLSLLDRQQHQVGGEHIVGNQTVTRAFIFQAYGRVWVAHEGASHI